MRLAEVKGAIGDVEVYAGETAEWSFVSVTAGRITDLRCGNPAHDRRRHPEHGMTGEIVIH